MLVPCLPFGIQLLLAGMDCTQGQQQIVCCLQLNARRQRARFEDDEEMLSLMAAFPASGEEADHPEALQHVIANWAASDFELGSTDNEVTLHSICNSQTSFAGQTSFDGH